MANFRPLSRYTGGIVIKNRSDKDFLILRRPLELEEDSGDIFITISKELENRIDLVSSKAYDTPELWWVIAEFNNITDPLFGLSAGQILRIPDIERVLQAIANLET
jgi:hypothetical protein